MKKINNWDGLKNEEVSSLPSLPVGNYICQIKNVVDVPEKEYLKVQFDIVKGDFKDHFSKLSNNNLDNWVNQGTTYRSYKASADQFFRNFITAIEKTNKGYVWDWNEKSLIGKGFVAVFGEEEWQNDSGEINISIKIREIRSLQALQEGKIDTPKLKKFKPKKENKPIQKNDYVYDITSDDLPF